MTKPTVDELLRASGPRSLSADPGLLHQVTELVTESKAASVRERAPRRKRRLLILIPSVALGVAVLTAGAAVTTSFVGKLMSDIVTVPISYTTDTGKAVSCTVTMGGDGSTDAQTRAIADFVRGENWSGIGQRIYDYAIAHPWKPNPGDSYQASPDGPTVPGDGPMTQRDIDNQSWDDAMNVFVPGPIPQSISTQGSGWMSTGWRSDCTGELH